MILTPCSASFSSPAVWLMKRPGGQYNVIEPEKSILLEVAWRTSDEDVEINGETVSELSRSCIYKSIQPYQALCMTYNNNSVTT